MSMYGIIYLADDLTSWSSDAAVGCGTYSVKDACGPWTAEEVAARLLDPVHGILFGGMVIIPWPGPDGGHGAARAAAVAAP